MPMMAPREKEGAGLDVQHRSACAAADSLIVSKVYPKPAGKVREKSIFAFGTPSEGGREAARWGRRKDLPDVSLPFLMQSFQEPLEIISSNSLILRVKGPYSGFLSGNRPSVALPHPLFKHLKTSLCVLPPSAFETELISAIHTLV